MQRCKHAGHKANPLRTGACHNGKIRFSGWHRRKKLQKIFLLFTKDPIRQEGEQSGLNGMKSGKVHNVNDHKGDRLRL